MNAGVGQVTINAHPGAIMDGRRASGGATGSHDDLSVRALFLSDRGRQVAIVGMDLLFAERDTIDRLKGAVERVLGIAPHELLINFSHTHAAPCFSRWNFGGPPDALYVQKVEDALIVALAQARTAQRPVRLFAGSGRTRLPLSRRQPDDSGRITFRPNPHGSVCDVLPYCMFKDAADAVVAMIFSVSCHPSIIFLHDTTADFPGVAVAEMNRRLRTGGSIFLQGAGGDAKPRVIALDERGWRQDVWADVEAAGRQVADELTAALENAREVVPDLRARLTDMVFPLRPAPDAQQLRAEPDSHRRPWVEEMLRRLELFSQLPQNVPVSLHAVQLAAGVRLVGVEAELTSDLGNAVLAHFGEGVTFPMGYTNGVQLYLPSDRQLGEGGYEAESAWEYHWPSNLAHGVDARLGAALRDLGLYSI